MRFLLLANPENRRVSLFQEALARQGQAPADIVSWAAFLADPWALAQHQDEPLFFRIDSFGENARVEKQLLVAGYEDAQTLGCAVISPQQLEELPPAIGRIVCPRQGHLGFERALAQVQSLLATRPHWVALNPIGELRECFDKRVTSRRFESMGLPVPPATRADLPGPMALRREMQRQGWSSAFVKLSCGSSASCLGVLTRLDDGSETFHTTIEVARDGWFNNLQMRHVRARSRIDELLTFLLNEGAHVEQALPKAQLNGAYFDLRVLCIDGEPGFIVLRQNQHQVTNLHLGGWRGDLAALRSLVAPEPWEAAMESCRQAAGCYRALHVGIDLMFEPGLSAHRIIEVNAFGDLLPNLEINGLSVYETEIRAALKR